MKTVILCGGLGTRLSEETTLRPKPMVSVGPRPILWHIMQIYSSAGFNEFVLALGYKSEVIKEYFLNYNAHSSNLHVDLTTGAVEFDRYHKVPWKVSLIETGHDTMTGGRVARLREYLKPHGTFMVTYGDGVTDLNVAKVLEFHRSHGKTATVTAVHPLARFGGIESKEGRVMKFAEKPRSGEGWINGGFFVFEPEIFNYLDGDDCILERAPLEKLTKEGQLMAYHHDGFWQCMDTVRDRQMLEEHWQSGRAPWKVWKDV